MLKDKEMKIVKEDIIDMIWIIFVFCWIVAPIGMIIALYNNSQKKFIKIKQPYILLLIAKLFKGF